MQRCEQLFSFRQYARKSASPASPHAQTAWDEWTTGVGHTQHIVCYQHQWSPTGASPHWASTPTSNSPDVLPSRRYSYQRSPKSALAFSSASSSAFSFSSFSHFFHCRRRFSIGLHRLIHRSAFNIFPREWSTSARHWRVVIRISIFHQAPFLLCVE